LASLQAEFAAEVARLACLAATSVSGGAGAEAVAGLELAIRTAMTKLGGSLLEQLLGVDTGYQGRVIDCGAGHRASFVSNRDKTFHSVLGPIEVSRAYYHCTDCHTGVVPKDDQLAMANVSMSPGLRAMVDRVAETVPFAKASVLLSELAGIDLGAKRIERRAEADGAALVELADREAAALAAGHLVPLPVGEHPEKLYVAADGTGVPMVPAELAGRKGKAEDGKARTREVKLAVCFTQTDVDDEGYPVRDPGSCSYVATFETVEHFGLLAEIEARRRGCDQAGCVVILGDGSPWIWNLAAHHFPTATQILDLYHAREHLHDLAKLIAPILDKRYHPWLEDRLAQLDAGDIEGLCDAARQLKLPMPAATAIDNRLSYFETNAHRMRYAAFRQLGHFVGSGAVESGCKAVIGQRLKLSGMRWSEHGATSIATLRCQEASGRWEQIWQRLNNQTSVA
jgi:hypothetical protein